MKEKDYIFNDIRQGRNGMKLIPEVSVGILLGNGKTSTKQLTNMEIDLAYK